jgi:DNA-binding transcriptional MerR regulator
LVSSVSEKGLMAVAVGDAVGVSRRTVQFWADQGALVPLDDTAGQGRGRQRVFDRSELPVAAILAELAALKMPVSALKSVATFVRAALNGDEESDPLGSRRDIATACVAGELESYIVIEHSEGWLKPSWVFGDEVDYPVKIDTIGRVLRRCAGATVVNVQSVMRKLPKDL